MQIGTRIKINIWISFAVFISMAVFLAWSLWSINQVNQLESLVNQIRKTAYERIFLRDDYLLHQKTEVAVEWKEKSENMKALLEKLKGKLIRVEDEALLSAVQEKFNATYTQFLSFIKKYEKKGRVAKKIFEYDDTGRKLAGSVFLNAYALQDSIDRLYDSIEDQVEAAQRRMVLGIVLFVLGGVVMIAFNAVFLSRTIAERIFSLNRSIISIGSGNLECRIEEEGDDELTSLSREVNAMTARLRSSLTSIESLHQEINLRQQAEEALRSSESLLNETGTMARIGGWTHDLLTGKASWTLGLYEVIEIAPEDPIPGPNEHLDYYPPQDRKILKAAYENAVTTGEPFDLKLRCHTAKGRLFWAHVIGRPYFSDGKCVRMAGTFQDINDLKLAEENLRRSEARYRLLTENTNDVIWTMDMNGKFTYVSPSAYRLHGYSAEELMQKPLEELIAPDSLPVAIDTMSKLLEKGRQGITGLPTVIRLELCHKDGSAVWTEISGELIRDENNDAIMILAVTRNISERRQAEEQIHKLNRTLTVLSDINQAIVRVRDLPTLFDQACHIAVEKGGFRMAWIGLLDDRIVRPVAYAGMTDDYAGSLKIYLLDDEHIDGPAGTALKRGEYDICNDVENDPRMAPWLEDARRQGYRSSAAFPIMVSGQVCGVFNLYSGERDFFSAEEITLFEELIMDVAFAMEHFDAEDRRLAAETTLRESEAKFAAAFNASPDLMAITRLDDGKILEVNDGYSRMLGYSRGESLGKTTTELAIWADQEDRATFAANLKLYGQVVGFETRLRCKNGTLITVIDDARIMTIGDEMCVLSVAHDITKRKKMEEALINAAAEWTATFDAMKDGVCLLDTDATILRCNRAFTQLLGKPFDNIIGRNCFEVLYGNQENADNTPFYRMSTSLKREETEMLLNGRWFCIVVDPILNHEGRLTGAVHITTDITERKRSEETIIQAEKKYRSLFMNAQEGIYQTSPDGQLFMANPAMARIYSYESPKEMLSEVKDVASQIYFHPEDRKEFIKRMESDGMVQDFEVLHRRKDGTPVWIMLSAHPMYDKDSRLVCYEGTVEDITERKAAERERMLNEKRLETLIKLYEISDQPFQQLSLYVVEECIHQTESELAFIGPISDDGASMGAVLWSGKAMDACAMGDKPVIFNITNAGIWADAVRYLKPVIVNDYAAPNDRKKGYPEGHVPLRNFLAVPVLEKGRAVLIAGVANKAGDYTDADVRHLTLLLEGMWNFVCRKRAEEESFRKHYELEAAHEELKQAQARVIQQEKMASIGQLAAGITHEINNPMSFITGNLDILRTYIEGVSGTIAEQERIAAGHLPPELLQELQKIKSKRKFDYIIGDMGDLIDQSLEGAERVRKIVADLKTFSRMEEDVHMIEDINIGLESTINIVWNEIKYKAELVKELGALPLTHCNISQINQVFMNLLVNAAQSIEKWGRITVKTWADEKDIYVSIADTGSGVPESNIQKIFNPFFTTKASGKGTGLGLSISLDIVRKHRGDIVVESEVGKGSTFTVRLPIVKS